MIAASVDRRISCAAEEAPGCLICVDSDDGERFALDLSEPDFAFPREDERFTSKAIVRGMASKLMERGADLSGCKLSFTSDIPIGMGLSSSAAFELCSAAALLAVSDSGCGGSAIAPMDMAKMAVQVEQEFFGKPCGLMDQAACALGGVLHMDFSDPENPDIFSFELPQQWDSYDYLLVSAGSGHEDLTSDYAGVATDMRSTAALLKVGHLRDMGYEDYLRCISRVREDLGDAAALRALGFYAELDLVERRLRALREGDMGSFISLTESSGVCSAEYLQNVSTPGRCEPAMVALALSRCALSEASRKCGGEKGSARIHGGGFGGTIQVVLPHSHSACFEERINELLGFDCCMHVRLGVSGIETVEGA